MRRKMPDEHDTEDMNKFAIALDIGTTNIGGTLIDLDKKEVVSALDRPNEQIIYGDDIISRLKFAIAKNGTEELNKKLINSINSVIDLLVSQARVEKKYVTTILAVGNAAMYHLTLLLPVETLARAPFKPFKSELIKNKAEDIGLKGFTKSEFIFLPNIGGFVGSDAIGVVLALDIHKRNGMVLAIDLGTNGEVILGNNKKILVSSTAAGPAFEGWHISCGSRPVQGAIISFEIDRAKISLKTIGGRPTTGIASSGLIRIVSAMIEKGIIDKTGRLSQGHFTIYENGEREILLDQKDIREIQLAKSAIHTAVNLLKENYCIEYEDIDEVVVTGRFGGSLNKEDLVKIGIVPRGLEQKRFRFVEDLALRGASAVLTADRMDEIGRIIKLAKHIELRGEQGFQEKFIKGLHFNETLT